MVHEFRQVRVNYKTKRQLGKCNYPQKYLKDLITCFVFLYICVNNVKSGLKRKLELQILVDIQGCK